ncbi:hypothetical protein [Microtetraspora sp. NBRC 16547]|uniref:hypothetical protein n=1 Tax=Microtetraspora sp. NBRC 16547 TaxID=3030993 RepID=UPI0024A4C49A|nr:hypothetical protein [Microtetraspora sp. NBRC 16547]GLX01724.1 hypothetical protein Misp02_58100 [Microtetraspora sp. NBRC 16547]
MNDMESALARALADAASRAPKAPTDLMNRVDLRYHGYRRRRGATGVVAALAVVAVAGGSTVALRGLAANPADGVRPADGTIAAVASGGAMPPENRRADKLPPPVQEVWPRAVREIPAKLPDGKAFQPRLLVDDDTLLITTEASFEKADRLLTYDLATGSTKEVARIVTPAGAVLFPSDFTVGSGRIAWWTAKKDGGALTADIWTVPVEGGTPEVLGSIALPDPDSEHIDGLAVTGDSVIVSTRAAGVWKLPFTGGEPRRIEGTEGYHLVQWPWLGTPDQYARDKSAETAAPPTSEARSGARDQPKEAVFARLRNAETGEERETAPLPAGGSWLCGLTWCAGNTADHGVVARHHDGTGERRLPGLFSFNMIGLDRFAIAGLPAFKGVALIDLETGKSADLGVRRDSDGSMSIPTINRADSRLLAYPLDGKQMIVDLSAIS